ncbi:zinc finger MYM-type protein 5-like [Diabrotica virgifera virgifera]|uniref:Zinc finger MYM-type protein 5-like n=1 Tax=Diabrotica virgifera virgifera TaxID=50390 RepID=A0ABM5KD34_DIAVI|nr:zinc finger MYM-type protein 5-like [Diabrotica virgifera virgifera]
MSSYKHKSGALKRKLQKEKLEQSAKGRQDIKKFFKSNEKEELQEFQPDFNPEPTLASQTQPSSASIQNASTSTVCEGSNDECASADPNLSKDTVDDNKTFNFDDPNTWPAVMSDKIRQEIVLCYGGFQAFQARSKSFPADPSGKHFHETLLYMKTDNRTCKAIPREWLMWSETKNSIHCLPCSIFHSNQNKSKLAKEGFFPEKKQYKRLYRLFSMHERSSEHRKHYLEWKSLQISLKGHGVDSNLQQIINCEATRWKAFFNEYSSLDTTIFLSSRGLAFQGENTQIGDVYNGNFLGVLELIGKYDEVTREHLAKVLGLLKMNMTSKPTVGAPSAQDD